MIDFKKTRENKDESENTPAGVFSEKMEKGGYIPEGYTLFAPLFSKNIYLVDGMGNVAHTWKTKYPPGHAVYLLHNGNIVATNSPGINANKNIRTTGTGFYVQEIAWDGKVVWNFQYSDDNVRLHHDVRPLPNGNVLMLAYERKNFEEAIAAGRKPSLIEEGFLLSERIIEVKSTGPETGEIVWMWNLWDHFIQDHDNSKENFGIVSDHPELLDINFTTNKKPDWAHLNSIDYNEEKDQILISSRTLGEIWIIDHSTTTKEASTHKGGRSGKGGDILYRWGNPQSYKRGNENDQKLFGQHDAQWIQKDLLGAGNILIFNNGDGRPEGEYSSIEEIILPLDNNGNYFISDGKSYEPNESSWSFFGGNKKEQFYSQHISGVQRLANGNTLVCVGGRGYFFEVTVDGKIAWSYQNTFCEQDIYKKKIAEAKKYTTSKHGKSSREKEAVFKARRYVIKTEDMI